MFRHAMAVTLPTLVLAFGLASPAGAQGSTFGKALQTADRNGDGEIDRREFNERMMDVFFVLDADKNGALAPSEVADVSQEAFRRADRNGDGSLQLEEFLDARAADFEDADADDDGTLTAAEVANYGS